MIKRWIIDDDEPLQIIDYKGEYNPVCVLYSEDRKEVMDLLNDYERESEQLKQQMNRLYNYFEDWYNDMTSANDFSEIWDNVKEDEKWGDEI